MDFWDRVPLLGHRGYTHRVRNDRKNSHIMCSDHRGKVMYFRDDREKIELTSLHHRVCFKNRCNDDVKSCFYANSMLNFVKEVLIRFFR